jgi:DNA-binding MarR family transcriptional regulator
LTANGYKNVNPTQALIIYHIGPKTIKATELVSQEFYNGSNASYNIRQMMDYQYLSSYPCHNDGRVVFLSLTTKGLEMYSFMASLFTTHQNQMAVSGIDQKCWDQISVYTSQVMRFWRKDEP